MATAIRGAIALLLAPGAVPAAAAQSDSRARLDSIVTAEMARQQIPGVAVAIVRNGQVLLAKGYGLANVSLA